MMIDPCQVLIGDTPCAKLNTKPYKVCLDQIMHRRSYQNGRNWVMLDVCEDCAKRMGLNEPVVKETPSEPRIGTAD